MRQELVPTDLFVPIYQFERDASVWSDWRKTVMLIKHLTWRHLAARYRGATLGFAWSFLNPMLLMGVYTFVFRFILQTTVPGVPFPVFLLTGILAWNFLNTAAVTAAVSLVSGASLINKTAFPRIALPISAVLSSAVNYLAAIPLLIVFGLLSGVAPTRSLLLLPLSVFLLVLVAVGVGTLFAALMPFFSDLQHLIEVLFTVWFFLTPVVYPVSLVPQSFLPWYELNPMVGIIQLVHAVFLGQPLPTRSLITGLGGTLCLLAVGLLVFRRMAVHCAEL